MGQEARSGDRVSLELRLMGRAVGAGRGHYKDYKKLCGSMSIFTWMEEDGRMPSSHAATNA